MARCSLCACCKAPEALVLLLWLTGCSPILLLRMSEEATLASYTLVSTQPIVWTLSLADSWAAESAGDPIFLVSCFILRCCLYCSSRALAGNQQKSRWQWQYSGHGNQQVSYRQIQTKTHINLPRKNVENSAENPEPIPMSSINLPEGYCYRLVLECCILHGIFLYTGLACSSSPGALWLEHSGSWLLLPCFWFSHCDSLLWGRHDRPLRLSTNCTGVQSQHRPSQRRRSSQIPHREGKASNGLALHITLCIGHIRLWMDSSIPNAPCCTIGDAILDRSCCYWNLQCMQHAGGRFALRPGGHC